MNNRLREKTVCDFYIKKNINNNYNIHNDLIVICKNFFGNIKELHYHGLGMKYKLLKQKIINENLIGLALYGASLYEHDIENSYINIYIQQNKTLRLTIKNIMETLLNNYFNNKELEQLCIESLKELSAV